MFTYPAYQALKQKLKAIAPVFYYIGQYTKGPDNTSYTVPAIYIEMPKASNVVYWGRGVRCIKPALVNIHIINNAPYKNHDNIIQDSAIAAHAKMIQDVEKEIQGLVLRKDDGRLLSQRFIQTGANEANFQNKHIFSVLSFTTEIYG